MTYLTVPCPISYSCLVCSYFSFRLPHASHCYNQLKKVAE